MIAEQELSRRSRSVAEFGGWPLVGWAAAVLTIFFGVTLLAVGVAEPGIRAVVRTSAQTSFVLFLAAFTASALQRAWPTPASRWLLTNRRYLGVSFAVSHTMHLAFIIALARVAADFKLDPATLIGGGLAYVFIAAMTATSFDRTTKWLGARTWRRLHTAGMYWIWAIFFVSYLPRALKAPAYMPFAALLVAAIGLRAYARLRAR